jgi:hypothetical protein
MADTHVREHVAGPLENIRRTGEFWARATAIYMSFKVGTADEQSSTWICRACAGDTSNAVTLVSCICSPFLELRKEAIDAHKRCYQGT